jgi:hypothetical protein
MSLMKLDSRESGFPAARMSGTRGGRSHKMAEVARRARCGPRQIISLCAANPANAGRQPTAPNGGYLKPVWKKPWSRGVFTWETCLPREVLGGNENQKAASRREEPLVSARCLT